MNQYPLVRDTIGEEIYFGSIREPHFKTNLLAINLILPLTRENATGNALVPMILERGNADFPTYKLLSKQLNTLYGATVGSGATKIGDRIILSLLIHSVDDEYALKGEPLLADCAQLLLGLLLRPYLENNCFSEQTVELQKQNLIDAIEAEINEKRRYAVNRTVKLMYGNEPFGVSKNGYVNEARAMTAAEATAHYQRILKTARIEILHVGRRDGNVLKEICREAFSNISREVLPPVTTITDIGKGAVIEETEEMQIAQSKLCLGFKTGISADSPMLNPMRMMIAVLGGTPTSKLFLNVREKLSLCYYCSAQFDRTKGLMLLDSGVEQENIEAAKTAILAQLDEMKAGDFTDTDMEFARLSLQNTFRSMGESPYMLELYYLTQTVLGIAETPEQQSEKIAAVTKEDIVRAASLVRLDTVFILTSAPDAE